jgi:predicted Zn-dependent protease
LYAVLRRFRGADNATPLDRQTLQQQLADHPWCEPELLLAMRPAIRDADQEQVHAWLDLARQVSPGAALAAQGRYHLLTDQPAEAIHDATMLMRDESVGRLGRRYGTDIGARAHVQKNTAPLGVGMIESLAIAAPYGKVALQLASVDVLIDSGRDSEASAALVSLMGDQAVSSRWLDRMLVRAAVIMGPKRLDAAIETLLQYRRDDPLLLVYRAWCRGRSGDLDGARRALHAAETQQPQSPRIRMMSAALHIAGGENEQARAIYRDLQSQPGRVGAAAQRELERMSRSASTGGMP